MTTRRKGPPPTQPDPAKRKPRRSLAPWTPERKAAFLEEFRKTGQPGIAAKAMGSSRRHLVRVRAADPAFDEACNEAWEDFKEWTISQVQRHAWEGVKQPIYQGGELVGVKIEHNTRMMELEAKRVVPEYRDKQSIEHSSDKPVTLQMAWVPTALRGPQAPPDPPAASDDGDKDADADE